MTALSLEGHLGRTVDVDICDSCQALWFDKYESLQLSASSVLQLFRVIGQASSLPAEARSAKVGVKTESSGIAKCPRCDRRLRVMHDLQRSARFEYRGCPDNHGRLITFFNFLREKNFIKPLSPAQIEELRSKVRTINCSNCGASVDLAHGIACSHCGSPLSMLDLNQAEDLIAKLRQAGSGPQPVERTPPAGAAGRRSEAGFGRFAEEPGWYEQASTAGLIAAAIATFGSWTGNDR
jgi:DNA-directed RNA polymerase subunit RPC12/RpoP